MTIHQRDAWDETGDMSNGILGQHLKCAKGKWLLDDVGIETGDGGMKICVVMDSAVVGQVLWQDQKIVERNVGRIADGFVPPRSVMDGWNPYVAFQAVRADENHRGDLITFTSSSWGGRFVFQNLVNPFRLKQRLQFPICSLGTKERGDANGNIDPVFKLVGWSARGNFQELLPPSAVEAPALEYSYDPANDIPPARDSEPASLAEVLNDDIPF
jgi:hypothetical protein